MSAKVTSKGQITLPKALREALGLAPGDRVLFRVENGHALLARTPNLLELAGSIPVPAELRGASWDEIMERMRRARGERLA
ncbi:MAG TPA: AbrB/MazE/SpoVT family DNA-binding domain-containing protein [Gaiellaceae bacterium]|nr:AbrB/MazE/SpoVT family DNA-binding domain-containing protein [Gaiellaceae bacterium]